MTPAHIKYRTKYGNENTIYGSIVKKGDQVFIYRFEGLPIVKHKSKIISITPFNPNKTRVYLFRLKKKWFDMIIEGIKTEEYREFKPYWIKRLLNKEFDEIEFINGYGSDNPYARFECIRVTAGLSNPDWTDKPGEKCFIIQLGKLLELKNYERK